MIDLLIEEIPAQERFRIYLKHNACRCPWCASNKIEADHVIVSEDDGRAWQEIQCCSCGKIWLDIYKLVKIEEITDENKLDGDKPLDQEAVRLKV